jgi:3-methylcrotonyl-CoA carboxylase beta subunit
MSEEAAMVRNTGSLYLAGPPLVKAATGEVISAEDLGGAYVHCSVSGCVDHFATSEEEAIQRIRQVMTSIDIRQTDNAFSSLPEEDSIEEFAKILPDPEDNYYRDFPMMEVISKVVDGGRLELFKELYGSTLLTGFAHISGQLVGVVANNGPLLSEACLKGTHFTFLCSQRGIPMVFLHNTHEEDITDTTSIKQKSTMISAVASCKIPKISIVVGRSFGTSSYAMCNRSMGPNFLFSWPHAMMGGGDIDSGQDSNTLTAEHCSSYLYDDGILFPNNTRQTLSVCLDICSVYKQTTEAGGPTLRF